MRSGLRHRRERLHRGPQRGSAGRSTSRPRSRRRERSRASSRPLREHDLVVRLRARAGRRREPVADLDALHRLDRHQRRRQARVELAIPVHVGAEPGRRRRRRGPRRRRPTLSLAFRSRSISATIARAASASAHRTGEASIRAEILGRRRRRSPRLHLPDLHDVGEHPDAQLGEERLAQRARRHPRRRLAGARPLQDVADVVEPVLQRARPGRRAPAAAGSARLRRDRPRPRRPSAPRTSARTRRSGS